MVGLAKTLRAGVLILHFVQGLLLNPHVIMEFRALPNMTLITGAANALRNKTLDLAAGEVHLRIDQVLVLLNGVLH